MVIRGKQPQDAPTLDHELYELKWENYIALVQNGSALGLAEVVPIARATTNIQRKGQSVWITILGVTPEYLRGRNQQIAMGEFISSDDNTEMRLVAVLGSALANELFAQGEYPLGTYLKTNGKQIQVVGVLSPTGTRDDRSIILPFMTVQRRLLGMTTTSGQPLVDEIHVRLSVAQEVEAKRQAIAAFLRLQRDVGPLDHDNFEIESAVAERQALNEITSSLSIALAAIAAISLFVGGVGVTNIMLVSLGERTREIGIRYSVGANPFDISMMFLLESIILCTLGGVVGLSACAYGIVLLRVADIPAVLGFDIVVLALFISIGIGLLAGIYPALRARKATPAEALRFQ